MAEVPHDQPEDLMALPSAFITSTVTTAALIFSVDSVGAGPFWCAGAAGGRLFGTLRCNARVARYMRASRMADICGGCLQKTGFLDG